MSDFLNKPLLPDNDNSTPEVDDLEGYVRKKVASILQSDDGFVDFADINRLTNLIFTQPDKLKNEILYVECMPQLIALAEEVRKQQTNANEIARANIIKSLEE